MKTACYNVLSERRRASTAMAFSLHNHCPCRLLRRVHTRLTTAPRIDASDTSTARLFALETSCPVFFVVVEAQVHCDKQVDTVKEHLTRTQTDTHAVTVCLWPGYRYI